MVRRGSGQNAVVEIERFEWECAGLVKPRGNVPHRLKRGIPSDVENADCLGFGALIVWETIAQFLAAGINLRSIVVPA